MLATIALIILVLWALGLVAHIGGVIHLLLIIGIIMLIVHFMRGRGASHTV